MTTKKKPANMLKRGSLLEERLKDLVDTWFPETNVDGQVDPTRLYDLLKARGDANDNEFGLKWPGKEDSISLLGMPATGALHPVQSKSANWEEAAHALCIGDNLEIMRLLQPAYFGKVKAAIIDPPYNLPGDSIYQDDLNDPIGGYLRYLSHYYSKGSEDGSAAGQRHSAWLNMMLPRLFAVSNLLSDDGGVVFVVIDDHEVHRLRSLMDEVFGAENFVCTFIWEKRYSPAPDAPNVGYVHENIVCYRKTDSFKTALLPMTVAQRSRYKNPDNDPNGDWKPQDYTCQYTASERKNLYYPITNPHTGKSVWPKKTRVWACSPEQHEINIKTKAIWWPPGAQVPARKAYVKEITQGAKPKTFLSHEEVGHTDEATKELRNWLPQLKLTPKPTRLIAHLLNISGVAPGDIVLDPFARVGTTAEAVAQLNKEGRGLRLLMIQLPEPTKGGKPANMAEACLLRSEAAIKKIEGPHSGLRVFNLESSLFRHWAANSDTTEDALKELLQQERTRVAHPADEMSLMQEISLQAGAALTAKPQVSVESGARIFVYEDAMVAVSLAKALQPMALAALLAKDVATIICRESAIPGGDAGRLQFVKRAAASGKTLKTI